MELKLVKLNKLARSAAPRMVADRRLLARPLSDPPQRDACPLLELSGS